jgi:signal transduction histidine kinase
MQHKPSRFKQRDYNSLLSGGLLVLLLVSYIAMAYVVIFALGTLAMGNLQADLTRSPAPWWLNLAAIVLIVLTFRPVSGWLRERISDLVYAQYDNPYALIAKINRHLQAMTNPHLTLPVLVESIGTMLYLPYVRLELYGGSASQPYVFGSPPAHIGILEIPVAYLDQPLGALKVSRRAFNRPFSDSDRIVLNEIAQQVGIALYVAQLTSNLRTSRERLVIAREEERRRIRNDLHDGLAPTLSSFQLQLGAIRTLVEQNPTQAREMIQILANNLRQATADIRRLVYELRPPMLDELGLIAAIKSFELPGSNIHLDVKAPEPMHPLSAAVEVAVYRIASEAIHNVVKHAQATRCVVDIQVAAGQLTLTVTDDGKSLPANYTAGIGLRSMQERAAELGGSLSILAAGEGGAKIMVRLPLES